MANLKHILLNLFVIIGLFSCNTDDTNHIDTLNSQQYYEELDISYGENDDQKFDLYLPPSRSLNTKIMILIHGGGWSSGDKNSMNPYKDIILQDFSDVAVVNINYRLSDKDNSPYPMQLDDITAVVNYIAEKRNYYIISDEIGFTGTSAGAHLSLLWSYAFDTKNKTKMVCSIVGPTNFTDPAYLEDPNFPLLISQFSLNPTTSYLEEISPYHNVTSSSPPTILFYGGKDLLIPTTQGIALRDKLNEFGVTHEFTLYPDEGHGWDGLNALDTWSKIKIFMQKHLIN
ncbi:MAG: alpha/beta hydrolase [Flavobacteriaceae bacterium]|nr:alpha/beta hydrolase [Flavobacteriaceae bacterium]